jgi:hypothetical protein
MYETFNLKLVQPAEDEPLGTKEKFWFDHDVLGRCLFKLGRPSTGEHWAEKVGAEVAGLLGLPAARYEFAQWNERVGVLTPTFVPENCTLLLGNELLSELFPDYGAHSPRYRRPEHTLRRVLDILGGRVVGLPSDWTSPGWIADPRDVFCGYLVLDALLGNTDRHDENWGIIHSGPERRPQDILAPTFDHASSLACHLTDQERERRLLTKDLGYRMEAWAAKARSALYREEHSGQPMTTLDAFGLAAESCRRAARGWAERLQPWARATSMR